MDNRAFKNMLVAGAAAVLATCGGVNLPSGAQAAAASGGQCFNAATVNSFDAIDDDTVLVTVGVRNVYRLEIVGVCPDVDWSLRVGLRSRGGSSWVCEAMDAELLVPGSTALQRCPVIGVKKLSPAEVHALKGKRG